MATTFLRFTAQADAQAYVTAINAHSQSVANEPFSADWYPRQDTEGKWCAPFYGPPYKGEPSDFDKLRLDAEEVEALYWREE